MAEPRKVPFVTISSFSTSPPNPESGKKRRREDEAVEITFGKDGDGGDAAAVASGGGGGPFGNVNAKGGDAETAEVKPTVRLHLPLSEPSDCGSSEFNYGELVNTTPTQVSGSTPPGTMMMGGRERERRGEEGEAAAAVSNF